MSQRLARPRMMRVLGFTQCGKPIYPILGAEGEGSGNDGGAGGAGNDGGEGSGDGGDGGDVGDGAGSDDGPSDTVSREEFETLKRRLAAADKAKGAAEKKLADLDKEKLDAKERAEAERDEAKATVDSLTKQMEQMQIRIKFLSVPRDKFDWQDAETALALIDLSNVEIDESGKVTGLEAAMKKLADSKPFLLKPKDDDGSRSKGNSGSNPKGSAGNGNKTDAEARKALERKYPALAMGRVPIQ